MSRLQKALQGTTPSAFLRSPQPFGRPAGRAPCVSFQALFAEPVWRPCLERVCNASLHGRGAHTEPAHTAPTGARRLQETRSYFRARLASHWQQETGFAGKELTALSTPCSNNSLLQLPGWGDSKGPNTGDPGARLFFTSHPEDTNVWLLWGSKGCLSWKFDFLRNSLLCSLSFLKH